MKNDPLSLANAIETLGQIIPENSGRDAIHVAVEPMLAAEKLFPGQHVGITPDGASAKAGELIGIVDPFLAGMVFPGQRFWMLLFPRTITGLRHVWTHPSFAADVVAPPAVLSDDRASSEKWLSFYAEEINETLPNLMRAAEEWVESGDHYYGDGMFGSKGGGYNGKFEGQRVHQDFWRHYQVFKGVIVPPDQQESFFTCVC